MSYADDRDLRDVKISDLREQLRESEHLLLTCQERMTDAENEVAQLREQSEKWRFALIVAALCFTVTILLLPGRIHNSGWDNWFLRVTSGLLVSMLYSVAIVLPSLYVLVSGLDGWGSKFEGDRPETSQEANPNDRL